MCLELSCAVFLLPKSKRMEKAAKDKALDAVAADEKPPVIKFNRDDCPTSSVTVYSDQAEVTRRIEVELSQPGPVDVVVSGFNQLGTKHKSAISNSSVLESLSECQEEQGKLCCSKSPMKLFVLKFHPKLSLKKVMKLKKQERISRSWKKNF